MKNPRLVFVPDETLPYDATTFSRFNAQEMKSQSKPEAAVKLGKIVPDDVFNNIVGDIARYDRLSDYYGDEKAVAHALGALMQAGVINDKQMPEMRTGTALSAAGKELIENTLIGKVFQTSPDAVRQIISMPTLRQSIVMGLNEIAGNRTLAKQGYDLSKELGDAVDLVYRAKSAMPDVYTMVCQYHLSDVCRDCLMMSLETAVSLTRPHSCLQTFSTAASRATCARC